ncbi:MAG: IS4 family transposase [Blastocatellia bacterium]|nr:IS4 family transposase [Blastocatellia bacterium]
MRHSTPFFAAFAPLLFGRPPRGFHCALHAKVLAAHSLSQLREAFGSMIPDALLSRQNKGAGSRQRLFSPSITFWAFLAQVLSPNSACREAVRKVQAWWTLGSCTEMSSDTSAYCQARARLADKTLLHIHDHLVARMEANAPSDSRWLSREVKIVDGTNLSMPDTAQNQAAYPQPSSQKKGCGFPMMKLVALFSLKSGALLHFVRGTLHVHENQLFRALWQYLLKGDVILSDRGFCSFVAIASLLTRGVDSVMRLHQARRSDFRRGKRLSHDDILVTWTKPQQRPATWSAEEFAALPQTLTLRQIRLRINLKGARSRTIILVSTLLDPLAYPADAIRALYLERWSVELHFREIKIVLALDVLRCLTPRMIQKELLLHLIAYNLIRSLMQHAAIRHCVELRRVSFKGTLDSLRHFADVIHAAHGKPRKQAALLNALLEIIAKDQLPHRPGRNEPRVKKRRPKNYHLLTKPRHQMHVPPHRNRPKTSLS